MEKNLSIFLKAPCKLGDLILGISGWFLFVKSKGKMEKWRKEERKKVRKGEGRKEEREKGRKGEREKGRKGLRSKLRESACLL